METLQTAFVTGGASGIGLATVSRLAKDGFRVIAIDRDDRAIARVFIPAQEAVRRMKPGGRVVTVS